MNMEVALLACLAIGHSLSWDGLHVLRPELKISEGERVRGVR